MSAQKAKQRGLFGKIFGGAAGDRPQSDPPLSTDKKTIPDDGHQPTEAPVAVAAEDIATVQKGEPNGAESTPKAGWLGKLTEGLTKTSSKLAGGISGLFTKRKLEANTLDDLEDLLIQADLGVDTAMRIAEVIGTGRFDKGITAEEVQGILAAEVTRVLEPVARELQIGQDNHPHIILVVGVNGSGKTTTIGKLAAQFKASGKSVLIAAGDTFRAAAIEQLKVWGDRTGVPVVSRDIGADASGLAFEAVGRAQNDGVDVLLIDTAGRLQNKRELMQELEKIVSVIKKLEPEAPHDVLLVLDATTGQNALAQVEAFQHTAGVTGLIMTKLDGTARGGILVAIAAKYGLPVHAIGVGEGIDDLQSFDAAEFATAIAHH